MLGTQAISNHSVHLKSWRKSSEFDRAKLRSKAEYNLRGRYSVRLVGSNKWFSCEFPPETGVAEWIFINLDGMPIFHWCMERESVMLIG